MDKAVKSSVSGDDDKEKKALVLKDDVHDRTPIESNIQSFKDKLQPGDIILSKGALGRKRNVGRLIEGFQGFHAQNPGNKAWTHAGLYLGDGKIRHSYAPMRGRQVGRGDSKVRDHSIERFSDLGRDLIALRPKTTKRNREKSVELSDKLKGKKYNIRDAIRAGILPKKMEDIPTESIPNSLICTGLTSYVYPKVRFSDKKSWKTLLPTDFIESDKVKQVAAFSVDPDVSDIKGYLKKIKEKFGLPTKD